MSWRLFSDIGVIARRSKTSRRCSRALWTYQVWLHHKQDRDRVGDWHDHSLIEIDLQLQDGRVMHECCSDYQVPWWSFMPLVWSPATRTWHASVPWRNCCSSFVCAPPPMGSRLLYALDIIADPRWPTIQPGLPEKSVLSAPPTILIVATEEITRGSIRKSSIALIMIQFVYTTSHHVDCLSCWYDHSQIQDGPPSQHVHP